MPAKRSEEEKNIHKDHRQRLRARFRKEGLENFQPHEVLELLLFYSIPQQNTNPIGHRLIKEFGSIADVLDADFNALMKVDGIKEYSATLLKLIPELCMYYRASANKIGEKFDGINSIAKYCLCKYMNVTTERFSIVLLDNELNLLGMEVLADGGADSVPVDLEQIALLLLSRGCTNYVLVHNHLSGSLKPSPEDMVITRKIELFMRELNKNMLDHIILSRDSYMPITKVPEYYSIDYKKKW